MVEMCVCVGGGLRENKNEVEWLLSVTTSVEVTYKISYNWYCLSLFSLEPSLVSVWQQKESLVFRAWMLENGHQEEPYLTYTEP